MVAVVLPLLTAEYIKFSTYFQSFSITLIHAGHTVFKPLEQLGGWELGRILVGLLAVALLAACEMSIKGPSAEIGLPKLKVYSGSGFCPPGQAKKGRC